MRLIFEKLLDAEPSDPRVVDRFVRVCYGFFGLVLLSQLPGHLALFQVNQGLSAPIPAHALWGLLPSAALSALGVLLCALAGLFAMRRPGVAGGIVFASLVFLYFGQMVSFRQAPGVPLSGHEAHFLVPFFLVLSFAGTRASSARALVDVRLALRVSFVLVFWAAFWSKLLASGLYWLEEDALSQMLLRRWLVGDTWGVEALWERPMVANTLSRLIFAFEALAPLALWPGRARGVFVVGGLASLMLLRLMLGFPFVLFLSLGFFAFLPLSWFSPRLKA